MNVEIYYPWIKQIQNQVYVAIDKDYLFHEKYILRYSIAGSCRPDLQTLKGNVHRTVWVHKYQQDIKTLALNKNIANHMVYLHWSCQADLSAANMCTIWVLLSIVFPECQCYIWKCHRADAYWTKYLVIVTSIISFAIAYFKCVIYHIALKQIYSSFYHDNNNASMFAELTGGCI